MEEMMNHAAHAQVIAGYVWAQDYAFQAHALEAAAHAKNTAAK